jgi:hypothetical protein
MNRKNLTAAVLAGLAGAAGIASTAQAVNLNPDGLGQVLIYPYYTANGDNNTLISLVNTTSLGKAVKVRFLESLNSQEVLDFNLYMSPYDVWVAAVVNDAEGNPGVTATDTTCTVPSIEGQADQFQEFFSLAYAGGGKGSSFQGDGGPDSIDRAKEGHIEVIEMGVIEEGSVVELYTNHITDPDGYEIDHPTGKTDPLDPLKIHADGDVLPYGRPNSCVPHAVLWTDSSNNAKDGAWVTNAKTYLDPPSGGLFGGGAVVNVGRGTLYSYDARAVEDFSSDIIHFEPGNTQPSLRDGDDDPAMAYIYSGGGVEDFFFDDSVNAVSAVFMHDTMMNEYNVEDALNANSEWVVTFPTKAFYVNEGETCVHVDDDKNANTPIENDDADPFTTDTKTCTPNPALAPFTDYWSWSSKASDLKGACEIIKLGPGENGIWNREEDTNALPSDPTFNETPVFSPSDPDNPDTPEVPTSYFCYETNVVRFGALPEGEDADTYGGPTEIFGSTADRVVNIDVDALGFESGWVMVNLLDASDPNDSRTKDDERWLCDDNDMCLGGLPMTGFWAAQYENGTLEGGNTLANYGSVFSHKATRQVSDQSD